MGFIALKLLCKTSWASYLESEKKTFVPLIYESESSLSIFSIILLTIFESILLPPACCLSVVCLLVVCLFIACVLYACLLLACCILVLNQQRGNGAQIKIVSVICTCLAS